MVGAKSLCHLTILLLSFCFMVVKCSLEPTDQFTDTKQDALTLHKRPSFFVGSRYGRSGSSSSGSSLFATSKTRRLNVVPRNDRFFLSSRYGKRAEISTGTQLSSKAIPKHQQQQQQKQQQQQLNDVLQQSSSALPPYVHMSCLYTGFQNYYRCNSIDSMFYYKNAAAINDNDDDNEVFSNDTTADLLNDDNDDDNIETDNDVDDDD